MRRIARVLVSVALMASPAFAGGKTAAKAKPAVAVKKKAPPVSAEHKKELVKLMAGFKFGMSKDDVIATLTKQIDERYEDKIKQTTDVAAQDRIRRDKRADIARVSQSYVAFDNDKKTGWDVSIIENEFAHNTNEAMMEIWEKDGNLNQRRFFFFYEGKLWKMFVSLDVSILPEDKRNFDTFRGVVEGKYGPGDVDGRVITWNGGEFDVRAVDRLGDYSALGLAIEDAKVKSEVLALREQKKPPEQGTSPVIKAIVDTGNKDHPDIKANGGAVDAVIQSNK